MKPPSATPGARCASSATTLPSVPVFDRQVLRNLFGQDSGVIATLVQTFLASMATSMAALHTALAARDLAVVCGLAHRIKGAARMSGALVMAQAALDLEHRARQGNWEAAQQAIALLESQWQLVRRDLALDAARVGRIDDHAPP